jgi:endonuclease YncB( thermonuclease family)
MLELGIAGAAAECPGPAGDPIRVAGVDDQFELTLDNGRRLRLFGVEVPPTAGPLVETGRAALRAWLDGGPATATLLAGVPDRWGRTEAHVFGFREGLPPLSVAEALIEAGLARVRPEPGPVDCLQHLYDLEAQAVAAGSGLFADARFRPVPGTDRAALSGRAGEWVLVQGRVVSVNATAYATYLNFGPLRSVDFSVAVRPRLRPQVEARLGPLAALAGHAVAVRGLLDTRFGPQIDIDLAVALQHLDGVPAPAPYSGRGTRR